VLRRWPRVVAGLLGLIPVLMLGFIVVSLLPRSYTAVTTVGTEPLARPVAEAPDVPLGATDNCGPGEAVDNDNDGLVNDGCPARGAPEVNEQCLNDIDDDGDGYINDGCPTNLNVYGPLTLTRFVDGARELLSTEFTTIYSGGVGQYGLRPAIYSSMVMVVVAMAIAVPISLAMAVYASEFAVGWTGRALRTVLGILSGIPPIVYALLAVVFIAPFIAPKFTAGFTFSNPDPERIGADPETWPPPDVPWNAGAFPWDPTGGDNSVLLACILLAMLVIPFVAPLIEDALRNVPREPKEASLALGANRWYTMRRITLPRAMPGIVAAIGIGMLKVLGDVMIVLFVVGFETAMPVPLWDLLERTGSLTSTGASMVGGFQSPEACRDSDCNVGYFTALLLLIMAAAIIATTTLLQRVLRRRLSL
jgi:ABC-type phosphate transport system permease subunit